MATLTENMTPRLSVSLGSMSIEDQDITSKGVYPRDVTWIVSNVYKRLDAMMQTT